MREFEAAYQILGIHYDIQRGESFYNDRLPDVVERLLKSGLAEISEGAVCVFFRDIPELADKPCIIRKRDGGFNYATTDIATVDYRIKDLKADTIWIVTGAPQQLHFRQIFEIARREGYTADFRHITHGSILGEDRKLMKWVRAFNRYDLYSKAEDRPNLDELRPFYEELTQEFFPEPLRW